MWFVRPLLLLGLLSILTTQAAGQADTFSSVAPWVVVVLQPQGKRTSMGSGFVDAQGYVVTAAHVILQSKQPAFIATQGRLISERLVPARVVYINRDTDVAVLDAGLRPAGLRLQDAPAQSGDEVWAFGYEFNSSAAILRMARASIGQRFLDFFQVDGAVQPGFSGGPITTRGGRVVGTLSFGSRVNPSLAYLVPAHVIGRALAMLPSHAPAAQLPPSTPRPTTVPPSAVQPPLQPAATPSPGGVPAGVGIIRATLTELLKGLVRYTLTADKERYEPGEWVTLTFIITNTGLNNVFFTYSDSQFHDFVIRRDGGGEVARWSLGRSFLPVTSPVPLAAGKSISFSTRWKQLDQNDRPIPPGRYEISAIHTTAVDLTVLSLTFTKF